MVKNSIRFHGNSIFLWGDLGKVDHLMISIAKLKLVDELKF